MKIMLQIGIGNGRFFGLPIIAFYLLMVELSDLTQCRSKKAVHVTIVARRQTTLQIRFPTNFGEHRLK